MRFTSTAPIAKVVKCYKGKSSAKTRSYMYKSTGFLLASLTIHRRHQDIKPKNILVLGKQEESPYQRRFKLADLGISHFERHTPDDVDVVSTDTRGTRTYGMSLRRLVV